MKDGIDRNQRANKSKIMSLSARCQRWGKVGWSKWIGGLTSQFYFLSRYLPSFFGERANNWIRNNNWQWRFFPQRSSSTLLESRDKLCCVEWLEYCFALHATKKTMTWTCQIRFRPECQMFRFWRVFSHYVRFSFEFQSPENNSCRSKEKRT